MERKAWGLGVGKESWGCALLPGGMCRRKERVLGSVFRLLESVLRGHSTEPGLGGLTHFRKVEGREKHHLHPFVQLPETRR